MTAGLTDAGTSEDTPAEETRSTRAAAWQLLAYVTAGLRLATLAHMTPSVVPALAGSDRPTMAVLTWVVAASTLVAVAGAVLVKRRPLGLAGTAVDVAVAAALLVAGLWSVPPEARMGTWIGFQTGFTLCVVCCLMGVRSVKAWATMMVVLVGLEAVYLAPTVQAWGDLPALLGNLLTLLTLGPLTWYGGRMIVRIGSEADAARGQAAAAAKAAEEHRARLAIHNGTAVMRLLVESGQLFAGSDGLRSQAQIELNRMRAYLTGIEPSAGGPTTLAAVVIAAGAEFDDLPVTVVADLAQGVELSRTLADDLAAALRSVLLNVRQHAQADQVVLHAEEHEFGMGWEVTVHDNGRGFDTGSTAYGVGLRDVVVEQLAMSGVETRIDSARGIGTTVTLSLTSAHRPVEVTSR